MHQSRLWYLDSSRLRRRHLASNNKHQTNNAAANIKGNRKKESERLGLLGRLRRDGKLLTGRAAAVDDAAGAAEEEEGVQWGAGGREVGGGEGER